MPAEPEAQARAEIDRLLGLAGWDVGDVNESSVLRSRVLHSATPAHRRPGSRKNLQQLCDDPNPLLFGTNLDHAVACVRRFRLQSYCKVR